MKKHNIFLFVFVLLVMASACSTQKSGCEWKPPKRGIKYKGFMYQQQARVIEILAYQRNRADLRVVTQKGDTTLVKFGWAGIGTKKPYNLQPGTWLTIRYDSMDCDRGWVMADIKINK